MASVEALVTLEEFGAMPDNGHRTELVRGRIIEMPPPNFEHGAIRNEIAFHLTLAVKRQDIGRVLSNDAGVITEKNPDSVRGPDVAFYRNAKVLASGDRKRYADLPPDLVVEVRSPSDRWSKVVQKASEYLGAGVVVVVVLDPDTRSAHVFEDNRAPQIIGPDDTLAFPDLLGDFSLRVGLIFE